jgi:hypothetical protein
LTLPDHVLRPLGVGTLGVPGLGRALAAVVGDELLGVGRGRMPWSSVSGSNGSIRNGSPSSVLVGKREHVVEASVVECEPLPQRMQLDTGRTGVEATDRMRGRRPDRGGPAR